MAFAATRPRSVLLCPSSPRQRIARLLPPAASSPRRARRFAARRRARSSPSGFVLLEKIVGEIADAGQDAARFLAVDEAHAVALLQRHRHLQGVEGIEPEPRISAEDHFVGRERGAFHALVGRLEDQRRQLGDERLARRHARRRWWSQNAAASSTAASARSLRQGSAMSAAEPWRRITAWKPSSAHAIGERPAQAPIAGGTTKRGT